MAARRLLILMLVLLGVSTLAAALVPPQAEREGEGSAATTTTTRPSSPATGGRLVERTIRVRPHGSAEVGIRLGDQLALTVEAGTADQVEIPAYGLLEDVGAGLPARFDMLPDRTGTFEVRLVEAGRRVAEVEVGPKRSQRAGSGGG